MFWKREEARGDKGRSAAAEEAAPKMAFDVGTRETVESIVVAFAMAILFRTFVAEPFVIPTGSMAPTLMGRHKDVVCPQCGAPYQVSASNEVDEYGNAKWMEISDRGEIRRVPLSVQSGVCQNCRFPAAFDPNNPQREDYPSFNGDRVVVGKFFYQFRDLQRWDVAVFKYPGEATKNYIKRIVGLPGETIRIQDGDIFVKPKGSNEFQIERKPPTKLRAMLQLVYDNDYQIPQAIQQGWPARWQPGAVVQSVDASQRSARILSRDEAANGWKSETDLRSFHVDGSAKDDVWMRYCNFVPSGEQWRLLASRSSLAEKPPQAIPIADFNAYNSGYIANRHEAIPAQNWVGDLAVECTVMVESETGELVLELVKAGKAFRCRIDTAKGQATLEGPDVKPVVAETSVRGPGTYRLMFSNVDQQLQLWVGGSVVASAPYDRSPGAHPEIEDFLPVGIGAKGLKATVSHLKLFRDLFYIANPAGEVTRPDYPLADDQYFALGDNSACSQDGRYWGNMLRYSGGPPLDYFVKREFLIGKAVFVYWPHSWDRLYLGKWSIPFPFFPNATKMRPIR